MKYQYCSPIGIIELEIEDNQVAYIHCADDLAVTQQDALVNEWLNCYFSGKDPGIFPYPFKDVGTEFEKKLRKELLMVPFGQTVSYGELAKRISDNMSSRAVGHGLNRNPFFLAVPCHRVIGADNSLTGFAYGVEKKKVLLENEGHIIENNKVIIKKYK